MAKTSVGFVSTFTGADSFLDPRRNHDFVFAHWVWHRVGIALRVYFCLLSRQHGSSATEFPKSIS